MATVKHVLMDKGNEVVTVESGMLVIDAARIMNDAQIGAVVVVEEGQVVGMFSERDVLRRVVAKHVDPIDVTVGEVMTGEVICCRMEMDLEEVRGICMNRRIRHLPVVDDDDGLVGLVSIGDLNAWDLSGHKRTIHYLHEYLYGT